MSSVVLLREFIGERLSAAASEIFSEFEKTILRYEEELDRQRRLLDVSWKPELKLHRVDLQQEPVQRPELRPTDHKFFNQDRNSSQDQEESKPEPLRFKEEEQEFCTNQEEDQLHLKQEADLFIVTTLLEEPDHSEAEPDREQLISQISARPEDQDLGSVENSEWSPKEMDHTDGCHGNKADQPATSQKLFSCHICGETFTENLLWIRHIKVHKVKSQNSERVQYCCPTCGKNFSAYNKLIIHMRSHTGEKPFSCEFCGKKFRTKDNCKIHMTTHMGEKPFSCTFCDKTFSVYGKCKSHMRTHNEEQPYFCQTCGERFTHKLSLRFHMRLHPGEEGTPEQLSCPTCGRRCSHRSHLLIHMRTHTGEKPYSCQVCGKSFSSDGNLKVHMRTHTGEKPYSCNFCGKKFSIFGNRKVHMRTHTGEKPYSCKFCGKSFSIFGNCKVHMRTHIKEKTFFPVTPAENVFL